MSGKPRTPRDILADADRHRALAESADLARVRIRLSEQPAVKGGLLRFLHQESEREQVFDRAETHAIYEALGIVRDQHYAAAKELDARVRAEGGEQ